MAGERSLRRGDPCQRRYPGDPGTAAGTRGRHLVLLYLTLCASCHTVVRLTDEQAVVAEAELIALDVVSLAFCRRCPAPGSG